MDLYPSALLDSVVVITCAILLWKHARVSALHPAPVYLLFHVLVVTERVYSVLAGSPTLFTGSGRGVLPVSEAEIAWAVNLADLALITMTAAWIKVGADDRRKYGIPAGNTLPDPNGAMLSEKVIWIVGGIAAPIGLVALYYFGNTLTVGTYGAYKVDLGEWNSSSWIMITQSWAGLVLLCLIYYYGFRKMFVVPMCAYLLLMAVQGYNRFRVLLPLIYLLLVWLSRRGRKWPPLWMGGAGLAVLLVFYPLKTIGTMVQTGKPVSDIAEVTANMLEDVTGGHSGDQVVLDEFASTVSLVDNSDRYYYGTLYYPLLTLPVPRQWWPNKPPLNLYQHELSSPSRPMALAGMVATLHGESYANLGVLGIIIISYVSAYYLGWFYFAALRKSYFSVYRFTYVMVACNLIQVFRDGLISLVMFTLVNMMPLVAITVLSYLLFRRNRTWGYPLPSFVPDRERGATQA
jgi:hypothetical protein